MTAKNSDIGLNVIVRDSDDNVVNPASFEFLKLTLHQSSRSVVQDFELNDIDTQVDNSFNVYIDRANTRKSKEGKLFMTLTIDTVDSNFQDNKKRSVFSNIEVTEMLFNIDDYVL